MAWRRRSCSQLCGCSRVRLRPDARVRRLDLGGVRHRERIAAGQLDLAVGIGGDQRAGQHRGRLVYRLFVARCSRCRCPPATRSSSTATRATPTRSSSARPSATRSCTSTRSPRRSPSRTGPSSTKLSGEDSFTVSGSGLRRAERQRRRERQRADIGHHQLDLVLGHAGLPALDRGRDPAPGGHGTAFCSGTHARGPVRRCPRTRPVWVSRPSSTRVPRRPEPAGRSRATASTTTRRTPSGCRTWNRPLSPPRDRRRRRSASRGAANRMARAGQRQAFHLGARPRGGDAHRHRCGWGECNDDVDGRLRPRDERRIEGRLSSGQRRPAPVRLPLGSRTTRQRRSGTC